MIQTLSPLAHRFPTSPVPSISIDFAPVEEFIPEPPSPFASSRGPLSNDDESLRSTHLLPPPVISPRARHMYHMQQQAVQQHREQQQQHQQQQERQKQQGVDAARFENMLQFARSERPAIASNASKQSLELRKEVAFKAHQTRQAERRRLFLSKIVALPSPTATATPVTPPESPAVFHFTLPSPGLVSPLALFETYDPSTADVRIEQVDFRARAKRDADAMAAITRNVKQSMEINGLSSSNFALPGRKQQQRKPASAALPSLAQISARLNATNIVTTNRAPVVNGASRLPAFLKKPASPPSPAVAVAVTPAATPASRLPAFLRTREQKPSPASSSGSSDTVRAAPPRSPRSPAPPLLSVTPPDAPLPSPTPSIAIFGPTDPPTPSIAIFGPTDPPSTTYPIDDVVVLDRRARHAKDMFDKLRRRVSAPAELTARKESHPILKVRGGF